jgi:hypothetical protein
MSHTELLPVAWKVGHGRCWIQCRCPKSSKKLSKVKGAKLVAESFAGSYLRTWEVPWELRRSREWVIRSVRSIYGAKLAKNLAQGGFDSQIDRERLPNLKPVLEELKNDKSDVNRGEAA